LSRRDETQRRVRLRDQHSLAVRELGRGAPLILVHGFTGSSQAWPDSLVQSLAERFHLVIPDLIGHGESDPVDRPERFHLKEVVRDLEEVLIACGHERAHWLGYSMGGRVALGACALAPERVMSAVLEGSSPGLESETERKSRREADEQLARELETQGIAPFVERWVRLPLFASQARLSAEVRARQLEQKLRNDASSLAACLRGLGTGTQPSFWGALSRLSRAVLLVHGEEDLKFQGIAERMHDRLSRSTLVSIPNAGHTTHLEQPDSFRRTVLEFHASQQ